MKGLGTYSFAILMSLYCKLSMSGELITFDSMDLSVFKVKTEELFFEQMNG
jgi:hypothetical protein